MKSIGKQLFGSAIRALRCTMPRALAFAIIVTGGLVGGQLFAQNPPPNLPIVKMGEMETVDMSTATYSEGFVFKDSEADNGWYNHDEDYTLVIIPPHGKGVKMAFSLLKINNDLLSIYDDQGEANLIQTYTSIDWHTGYSQMTVMSHGAMRVHFTSDYHYKAEGWEATVTVDDYAPQPPVALMEACNDQAFQLLPTVRGAYSTTLQYAIAYGDNEPGDTFTNYEGTIATDGLPVKIKVRTVIKDEENGAEQTSGTSTYTFTSADQIAAPSESPTITGPATGTSTLTLSVTKPESVQYDSWHIRYTLDGSNPADPTNANAHTIWHTGSGNVTSGDVVLTEFCTV